MSGKEQVIRTQELPILDLGNFLTGNDVDLDQLADSLRQAVEEFGFFFIRNHGVSDNLIKRVFSENERWHNQPMEAKVAISIDDNQRGYIRPKATLIKHSTYNENTNLDTNETTVFATDYSIDNPNRQKGKALLVCN